MYKDYTFKMYWYTYKWKYQACLQIQLDRTIGIWVFGLMPSEDLYDEHT